jgi:predicted AAA+ superfamily ATPase
MAGAVRAAVGQFPVVTLAGARQCGKTTLLRQLFGTTHAYLSLDVPEVRAAAQADPRGLLAQYPPPVILDEVQHVPELLPYVKQAVDEQRDRKGQFLLSGSQNPQLSADVSETLAGRAAMLRLYPMMLRELDQDPDRPLPWERQPGAAPALDWRRVVHGFYPEIALAPERDSTLWYSSYVQTYLERDVRQLRQVGDLTQFQIFLRALAARCSQLLNLTELARDLGVAVNTVKAWLSVLEAGFVVFLLRPWFENAGKRLVKTPKVYFFDTGLVCYLTGLRSAEHAREGPLSGALMENLAISEVYRALSARGEPPEVYFWRTSAGNEVDLIVRHAGRLIPIEVKRTATPRPEMAKSIAAFQRDYPRAEPGYVFHGGDNTLPLGPATAWPVTAI